MKSKLISFVWSAAALVMVAGEKKCSDRHPEHGEKCMLTVTIQDYTGLDGCGLLLVEDNGNRFMATNLATYSPNATAGDVVRIDFEEVEDMMSICMAEKKIVRLTCFELVAKSDGCADLVDPYRTAWSKEVMLAIDPYQVELLQLEIGKAYKFIGKEETHLYNCHGVMLCRYKSNATPCKEVWERVLESKVIYVVNE